MGKSQDEGRDRGWQWVRIPTGLDSASELPESDRAGGKHRLKGAGGPRKGHIPPCNLAPKWPGVWIQPSVPMWGGMAKVRKTGAPRGRLLGNRFGWEARRGCPKAGGVVATSTNGVPLAQWIVEKLSVRLRGRDGRGLESLEGEQKFR